MRIDNAIPAADTAHSLELGMIRCVDDIREQVRRETGLSLTDAQIENAALDVGAESKLFRLRILRKGSVPILHYVKDFLHDFKFFGHCQHLQPQGII